jgi:predicted permease
MTTVIPRLERRSLLTGALVTIVLAVPPAVIGLVLSDDDSLEGSGWVPLLFFWIIVAFLAGGYVAARRQPHAPQAHGGLAVLLAYAVVQGVGVLRHLIDGEGVDVLSIVFAALLATSTGMVGGMLAHWRRVRSAAAPS